MTLLFATTQNQALLAFIVKIARENNDVKFLGRIAMQKLPYFLQVRGVPMNYRFDIYTYGPFSQSILPDVDWLLADGVISDNANGEATSDYIPGKNVDELIELHKNFIESHKTIIKNTVDEIAPLKPREQELFATMDFVFRQQKAAGVKDGLKELVISRFKSFKGEKFEPAEIEKAYGFVEQTIPA